MDDKIKTIIVLVFVGLMVYWGVTGFEISNNWVAILSPIILGYLFKPSKKEEKPVTNGSEETKAPETGGSTVGGASLYWRHLPSGYSIMAGGS